jgi:hypothetical protein
MFFVESERVLELFSFEYRCFASVHRKGPLRDNENR